jgi:hypothetical protein
MMKYCFFLFFTLLGSYAFSQDDMPDTRKKNEGFTKIADKEMRADIATFNFAGIDEAVGKEPIRKISFTSRGTDYMVFEGGGIKATVKTAPFEQAKHKLDFDEKYLVKIDRKTYYGSYPKIPKSYIKEVTVTVGKDTVVIPPTAFGDLYNPDLTYTDKSGVGRSANGLYVSKDGHKMYLYLFCKDSGYEVTFIIKDKIFVKRVLDYDLNL